MIRRTALCIAVLAVATIGVSTAAAQDARLFAIHGVPGLPEPVDVYLDGSYQFSFDFGDTAGPLFVPAGTYLLEIRLPSTDMTILSATADVAAGGAYTAIAQLKCSDEQCAGGFAPQLSLFDNSSQIADLRNGRTRLTVRHTALAPEVGVRLDRGERGRTVAEFGGLDNFSDNQLGPVDIRGGGYSAALTAGGADVFNSGKLELEPGTGSIVYAIGVFPSSFQLAIETFDLD